MIRSSLITTLVLSLCLVGGCDKPVEGTEPPEDGKSASKGKNKRDKKNKNKDKGDGGGDGNAEGGGGEEDPTQKVCPAEVADYPAPYFADTVLIRLPKGVSEDNFVEFNPGFIRLSSEVESVGCVEGYPGAMITYMAMASFVEEEGKTMEVYRDETLEAFGYKGSELTEEKIDEEGRFYQAVLEVPPDPQNGKPDPARALFQMKAANGNMYAIVFESHPAAWNALKETFYESAKRMSFLAPQG